MGYQRGKSIPRSNSGAAIVADNAAGGASRRGSTSTNTSTGISTHSHRGRSKSSRRLIDNGTSSSSSHHRRRRSGGGGSNSASRSSRRRSSMHAGSSNLHHETASSRSKSTRRRATLSTASTCTAGSSSSRREEREEETRRAPPSRSKSLQRKSSMVDLSRSTVHSNATTQSRSSKSRRSSIHTSSAKQDKQEQDTAAPPLRRTHSDESFCSNRGRSVTRTNSARRSLLDSTTAPTSVNRRANLKRRQSSSRLLSCKLSEHTSAETQDTTAAPPLRRTKSDESFAGRGRSITRTTSARRSLLDSNPSPTAANRRANLKRRESSSKLLSYKLSEHVTTDTQESTAAPPLRRTKSDESFAGRGRSITRKKSGRRQSLILGSGSTTSPNPPRANLKQRESSSKILLLSESNQLSSEHTSSFATTTKTLNKLSNFDPNANVLIQPKTTSLKSAVAMRFATTSQDDSFMRSQDDSFLGTQDDSFLRTSASLFDDDDDDDCFDGIVDDDDDTEQQEEEELEQDQTTQSSSSRRAQASECLLLNTLPTKLRRSKTDSSAVSNMRTRSSTTTRSLSGATKRPSQTTLALLAIASNIASSSSSNYDDMISNKDKMKKLRGRSKSMTDQSMYSTSTNTSSSTSSSTRSSVEESVKRMKGLQHKFRRHKQEQHAGKDTARLTQDIPLLRRFAPTEAIISSSSAKQQQKTTTTAAKSA